MEFPTNAGAIIEHTPSGTWYVRDQQGLWHNGSYSTTDSDFKDHVKCFPTHHKVVFEGLAPPTKEPKGLGAVVRTGEIRYVRITPNDTPSYPWRTITSNGEVNIGVSWEEILNEGSKVEVLSEGV